MKGKLFQERNIRVTNADKLSKLLLTFLNTRFLGNIKQQKQENVKYVTTTNLLFEKLKL